MEPLNIVCPNTINIQMWFTFMHLRKLIFSFGQVPRCTGCMHQSTRSCVDELNIKIEPELENANIIDKYGQSYKFEIDTLKLFKR